MSLQFSTPLRNAWLNLIESTIGTSPVMQIRTGAPPASCVAVATGTLLVTISLPVDWMAASSAGTKVKAGTWAATSTFSGEPGHFRIYDALGTTCGVQGTASVTGGAGDMIVNVTPVVSGFQFTVTAFTFTAPGG